MFEGFKELFKKPEETIGEKKEEKSEQKMKSPAGGEGLKIEKKWEEERKKDPFRHLEQK